MYFDFNILIICVLTAIASICLFFLLAPQFSSGRSGSSAKVGKTFKPPFAVPSISPLGDSASQLRHVMAASFYKKKLMNRDEYRVFKLVETEILSQRNGCRVLSQTSLGEIIGSDDKKAFNSINSKRVDILILGPYGDAIAAIEYQGSGHHQGTVAARDAIKREALRKAGVQFIEVLESHSQDEILQLVRRIFQTPAAAQFNEYAKTS